MTTPDGYLSDRLGGPAVLDVTLDGQLLPPSACGAVELRHGRSDPSSSPNAATCSFTFLASALPALPQLGVPLRVELGADALAYAGLTGAVADAARPRFVGHVTDVTVAPDLPGVPGRVRVTATSPRARLGRTIVGDAPWPAELDGARAGRILALAAPGVGAPVGEVDAGTVVVTARDVDAQPALALLEELARDAGGTLVDLRSGALSWQDLLHRENRDGTAPDVRLTSGQVLAGMRSQQKLAGLTNLLRVTYGPPPAAGTQRPTMVLTDPDSRTAYGPFDAALSVQLRDAADVERLFTRQLYRRSLPRWFLDALTVDLIRSVDPLLAGQLWRLEQGSLLAVSGLPAVGPFGSARLWIEGWTETITRSSWRMTFDVSSFVRTAGWEPAWEDVSRETSWHEIDPAGLTWNQAAAYDTGLDDLGRWADVAGSDSWELHRPPDATWASTAPVP